MFRVIAQTDEQDLSVIDLPFNWDATRDIRQLRVGFLEPAFHEPERYDDWRRNDDQTLAELRGLGLTLESFELPEFPTSVIGSTSGAESGAFFDAFLRSGRGALLTNQRRAAGHRRSRLIPAVEYLQTQRLRTMVMRQFAETVSRFDVYVAPYMQPRPPAAEAENTPTPRRRRHLLRRPPRQARSGRTSAWPTCADIRRSRSRTVSRPTARRRGSRFLGGCTTRRRSWRSPRRTRTPPAGTCDDRRSSFLRGSAPHPGLVVRGGPNAPRHSLAGRAVRGLTQCSLGALPRGKPISASTRRTRRPPAGGRHRTDSDRRAGRTPARSRRSGRRCPPGAPRNAPRPCPG